ncbi:glycosyltransferase family 1 protein [bacterium]|nr:MAG: glycosyltransferase family 1 protein [bacterium]
MRKRILIFSIAYEPMVGGAELAVRNITDRLPSYEFDLITCRFGKKDLAEQKIGNVMVYRVGFGSRLGRYLYPVLALRLASRLHRKKAYGIVWSIMAAYAGAAALMFKRRFPDVKFLLTLQEGDSVPHIHKQVRGFQKHWQQVFKKADYIQAISQYLADWAKAEGAACPMEVVPNGVTLSFFSPLIRGRLRGGRNSKFVIITTSRLVPKNGIDVLIKAVTELKTLIRDTRYLIRIVGSGPDEKKLKDLARGLNVDHLIEFVGEVSPDEIPEYLSQADLFVRPSRSEGLGSSFLEAMAAGLPVVGTAVGGIPDFLKDGETGFLAKVDDPKDLAQKIHLLLEDKNLYSKLSANGKKLVEKNYDWNKIANCMEKIFSTLN